MARNSFTVTVDDTTALTASLVAFPDSLKPYVSAAALITAKNIRTEAVARLKRQLVSSVGKGFGGHGTGETEEGILVNPIKSGWGWIVDAGNMTQPMLDLWLERGTVIMAARPFFFDSGRLEEAAHAQRINDGIQQAIADRGLGDA
jgi:hypothetical protein